MMPKGVQPSTGYYARENGGMRDYRENRTKAKTTGEIGWLFGLDVVGWAEKRAKKLKSVDR